MLSTRPRHIPKGVELSVRGDHVTALPSHGKAAFTDDFREALRREIRPVSRDRFQFVQGAAGVAQGTTTHHGDFQPARRGKGSEDEGYLVTHPSR